MSPEQRLTVREAVEMIARHGAAPISESALRARIRSRKIGVVKVDGRIYTNPLNLVTAGLLPVDVLSTTFDGIQEIDDAELHAWLNPDDEHQPPAAGLVTPDPQPADGAPNVEEHALAPEASDPGPLERTLNSASANRESTAMPAAHDARRRHAARTAPEGPPPVSTRRRGLMRRLSTVGVAAAVAVVAAVGAMAALDRSAPPEVPELRPVSLASALSGAPSAERIEQAIDERDFARALELAALSGNRALLQRTQRTAADAALTRAERARKQGRFDHARRQIKTVTASFGNPRPATAKTIATRIDRDEQALRRRAQARRAAEQARLAAAPATSAVTPSPAAAAATQAAPTTASAPAPAAPSSSSASSSSGKAKKREPDKPVEPDLF